MRKSNYSCCHNTGTNYSTRPYFCWPEIWSPFPSISVYGYFKIRQLQQACATIPHPGHINAPNASKSPANARAVAHRPTGRAPARPPARRRRAARTACRTHTHTHTHTRGPSPMSWEQSKASGVQAFKQRDFGLAVEHFRAALEVLDCHARIGGTQPGSQKDRAALYNNCAMANLKRGKHEEAVARTELNPRPALCGAHS